MANFHGRHLSSENGKFSRSDSEFGDPKSIYFQWTKRWLRVKLSSINNHYEQFINNLKTHWYPSNPNKSQKMLIIPMGNPNPFGLISHWGCWTGYGQEAKNWRAGSRGPLSRAFLAGKTWTCCRSGAQELSIGSWVFLLGIIAQYIIILHIISYIMYLHILLYIIMGLNRSQKQGETAVKQPLANPRPSHGALAMTNWLMFPGNSCF